MYDSRSSHPRGGVHILRAWRKDGEERLPMRPRMTRQRELAEAITDHEDLPVVSDDTPGLKRLARDPYAPSWWYDEPEVEDDFDAADEDEMLADWEAECAGLPEETRWSIDGTQDDVMPRAWGDRDLGLVDVEDVDDFEDVWLTVSPREFFDAVGDAWVVEGPTVTRPESMRQGHYLRVWELAREVGIHSKDLIDHLRKSGEWVKSHQSYVAMPVVDQVRRDHGVLVSLYGPATRMAPDTIDMLRERLTNRDSRVPGAPRPGAPRGVGDNPFLLAAQAGSGRGYTPAPLRRPAPVPPVLPPRPRPGNNPFADARPRQPIIRPGAPRPGGRRIAMDTRPEALEAADKERRRLLAKVDTDAPAKVERPIDHPVNHAEAPLQPWERELLEGESKALSYDDRLDPISPNFDIAYWGD